MLVYALKRLLLIPPTFFLISIVLFVLIALAPGRPDGGQDDIGATASAGQAQSWLLFKEQFDLDKPILLNTRFLLGQDDVREQLIEAFDLDHSQTAKARIAAREALDDEGNDIVRHLVPLLDDADPEVRRAAAATLVNAAQRRHVRDDDAANRAIERQNHEVQGWSWGPDDPPERTTEVTGEWKAWWAANSADFEYTPGRAAYALLFETRFAKYWRNLLHLDLGVSTVDHQPVVATIRSRLGYSLGLSFFSIALAYTIAVPTGIFSAVRRGTTVDAVVTVVLFMLFSLPTFFTGTVLLRWLTEGDPVAWFPTGGFSSQDAVDRTVLQGIADVAWHLVLPVATYTSVTLAALSRYARAGVIDVIRADYVRTARAKGLSEPVVILKHAARNGMIPILTLLGTLLPTLVSGSVVIEHVFGIPGMGSYLFDSIGQRDYNAVLGVLQGSSLLTLVGILVSDLSYAAVDPRISLD
jgi:peptide/nickel transport system permease protein